MSTAVSQSDIDALNDPDEWKSLSSDEQQRILHAGLEEEFGDQSSALATTVDDWDEHSTTTQRDTLAAIEGSLDETWTGVAFKGVDAKQSIPVELSTLTDKQETQLREKVELLMDVEQLNAETPEEALDEYGEDAGELFDRLDDLDEWLPVFLAGVSADPAFDEQWWTETDFPSGFKLEVFYIIAERYSDEMRQIQSFRAE